MNSFFQTARSASSAALGAGNTHVDDVERPWVEKYRPKEMKDIAYQEEVVKTLIHSIESGNLPHLLFYGPPGTGKTSTILAVARALFGPEVWRSRVLELNASNERGIKVVRTKVKDFAMGSVTASSKSGAAPFNLIILDEADSLTPDAQSALRRTMERSSKQTRFCLICNYVSRIIEPIASRCAKFRFKPLNQESMQTRLQHVADQENVNLTSESIQELINISNGDLRKAIMFLQSATQFYGREKITAQEIVEISGVLPEKMNQQLWKAVNTTSFDEALSASKVLAWNGYPMISLLSKVLETLIEDDSISDVKKAKIAELLATADKALVDGADEDLQTQNLISSMQRVLNDMQITGDTVRHF